MQEPFSARRVLPLLTGIILAMTATLARAGVVEDCRAEIDLYGIVPEQAGEYLQGCIQSRGGNLPEAGQPAAVVTDSESVTEGSAERMSEGDNSAVEETTDGAQ